jgi:hypothetical protein
VTTAFENEGNSKSATPPEFASPDAISRSSFCFSRPPRGRVLGSRFPSAWETRSRAIACGAGSGRSFGRVSTRSARRRRGSWSTFDLRRPARPSRASRRTITPRLRKRSRAGIPGDDRGRSVAGRNARLLQVGCLSVASTSMPLRADLLGLRPRGRSTARCAARERSGDPTTAPVPPLPVGRLRPGPVSY